MRSCGGYRLTSKYRHTMDREGVRRASRLLEKALSTNSEPEALALVEKAYPILARVINAAEAELAPAPDGRRRERRLVKDRRASRRSDAGTQPRNIPGAAAAYRDAAKPPRRPPGDVDTTA